MCARFDFTDAAKERLEQFLQTLPAFQNRENAVTALSLFPSGDVHPTEKAPVLSKGMQEGTLALSFPVWGFPGREGKLVINARAETVREKPMFREAAGRGRCIIPAGTFKKKKKGCTDEWIQLPWNNIVKISEDMIIFKSQDMC